MVTHELSKELAATRRRGANLATLFQAAREFVKRPFYGIYERQLAEAVGEWEVPHHIGIIMDGNRRFARQSGLATVSDGHRHGAQKLWEVLNWCYEAGVRVVTVWSFSIDNFERESREIEELFDLFESKTRELTRDDRVHEKQIRIRYIGELGRLPEGLRDAIGEAESATAEYEAYRLNIAMAYGGREEITEAFRRYLSDRAQDGADLETVAEELKAESIGPYLYTSGQPEPDLIVRTSGEVRLSGFLLWQSAYSEYYFCDTHWPAFRKIDFLRALRSYHDRHRRFGR